MKLVEYIHSNTFKENYKVSSNGELYFHWANWGETCKIQKDSIGQGVDQVDYIDNALESLRTKPVWYQRNLKTVKSNLYELYEAYLDPRLKATWHDFQKNTLVSLQHEGGPYISLTSMRWMDKSTYSFFVYRKLLTGYHPLREFRLSADIDLIGEINESPLNNVKTRITQFSQKGLILSIDGHDFNKFMKCDSLAIKVNLNSFKNHDSFDSIKSFKANSDKADQTMYINGNVFSNMGNLNNANYSNGNEYFFFIPYTDITFSNSEDKASKVFGNLVSIVEKEFEKEISSSSCHLGTKREAA